MTYALRPVHAVGLPDLNKDVHTSLQDIEADCNRLLETGLFARVRPKTQLPLVTQAPNYLRDRDGHLNPVIPLNQVWFESPADSHVVLCDASAMPASPSTLLYHTGYKVSMRSGFGRSVVTLT